MKNLINFINERGPAPSMEYEDAAAKLFVHFSKQDKSARSYDKIVNDLFNALFLKIDKLSQYEVNKDAVVDAFKRYIDNYKK